MAKSKKRNSKISRESIIRTVQTPLGFFVFVVLVMEAILGGVSYFTTDTLRHLVICAMVVLIFALVIIVALMAYYRPEALRGERFAPQISVDNCHEKKTHEDNMILNLEELLETKEQDRIFGLFSNEAFEICPITVRQIIETCVGRGTSCNSETIICIRRIIDLLEKDKNLKNIDYSLVADNRLALKNLETSWRPCLPERDRYISLQYPKLSYKSPMPPTGIPQDILQAWIDMATIAKKMLRQTFLSPYRLVLSYSNQDYMTITSTLVSKENIIPYSHTPVIERKVFEPSYYYGKEAHSPSSETVPHLNIHQYFEQKYEGAASAVIHCHPAVVLTWLKLDVKHTELLPEDGILDYIKFGTKELGEKLAETLCSKRSAIVRKHGVWTAGRTFDIAYLNFIKLIADIGRLTGGDIECLKLQKRFS